MAQEVSADCTNWLSCLTPAAWSALADWVMALAAFVAAFIALKGLNAWKNQNIWAADADLARHVLIAVYRFRDSLYAVRHPAMSVGEMRLSDDEKGKISDGEARRRGTINAYSKRWGRHQERAIELDAHLIEADAVWGTELSGKVAVLKNLEHELWAYISLHLDAHCRGDTVLARSYRDILKEKRDILYDMMNDDDVFRKDFIDALKPVERYLRGKLGRAK